MQTFHHILKSHYENRPDEVAIYLQHAGEEDKPITVRDMLTRAVAAQKRLEAEGIQPGEVVLLIFQHGEDLITTYFGAILHGAIPSIMPYLTEKLQPERYRKDLASLIEVTQPAAIFTYGEFEAEVRSALIEGDSVRTVMLAEDLGEGAEPVFDLERRKPEDIVLLQHSSGTTGLQKGVALSHQSVLNQITTYADVLHITNEDVLVSWLPLYHDMGLIAGFLMPILYGLPLVLMSPFDWVRAPYRLMQAVSQYKGTLVWLPNFAYNFCATKIRDRHMEGVDLSSWRLVTNCSEPMRYESHQLFVEAFAPYGFNPNAIATSYAMAENTFAVTQGGVDSPVTTDPVDRDSLQIDRIARPAMPDKPSIMMVSAGKPVPNTQVKIVDPKGNALPDRHIGEIALFSNCMLTEYYHRPKATQDAFLDGWYLTGDYGYMLDGEVYITGRKKDLIIVGGKNIYPQDIERIGMTVPGVHPGRAVAFGIFSKKAGTEEVVLVAEVDTDDPAEKQSVADQIRKTVTQSSAVALRHVHLVPEGWIIKTSSGKTARLANRDKFVQETGFALD
ncbi:MAG: AMP-binding protein [Anaerolineaceae bacterium]|nr:AMP-binding protein [Anaerolineaceae bacterium]